MTVWIESGYTLHCGRLFFNPPVNILYKYNYKGNILIDISLIKAFLSKATYNKHRDKLQVTDFSKDLQGIVRVIDNYYKDYDSNLTVDSLANLYFSVNNKDVEYYQGIFENIKNNEASDESIGILVSSIRRNSLLRDISLKAYEVTEGRGNYQDVVKQLEQLKDKGETCEDSIEINFVSDDLIELIDASRAVEGMRWRLNSLNKALGSIRKGDFGFVFARPETGKTTFLASEVTYMAEQATQPVLWLNNEEQGNKVMLRCIQASCGVTLEQLLSNPKQYKKEYDTKVQGRIKLYDSASITKNQVEKLIDKVRPSLVVFDQIDKIKGFDNDREDLRLGSIYIWARELAKTYAPIIGICQADGSGEGQRWLTMANVANAKTSKQAEADWILGIGKLNEAGYDNLRFLHLSKNKLCGDNDSDPQLRHGRWECLIDPIKARYLDL